MNAERDAVTGPAPRPARYHCKVEGKLAPFPYRIQGEEYGMKLFVGLDVSLNRTAICVVSEHGKIVKEAQVAPTFVSIFRCFMLAEDAGSKLLPA